jgi:hypothetical protein
VAAGSPSKKCVRAGNWSISPIQSDRKALQIKSTARQIKKAVHCKVGGFFARQTPNPAPPPDTVK